MSRPFTNSLAKSLYASPRHVIPPATTPEPAPSSPQPTTPAARYPSPLPKTPLTLEQTPTGKWEHPAVSKVSRLQSTRAPNDTTVRRILVNLGALFLLYKLRPYLLSFVRSRNMTTTKYTTWAIWAVCLLLVYNVLENVRRFWWTSAYDDPTLSAKQRSLLNLPASPASAPGGQPVAAITPPRYQKSFTPSPSSQSPLSQRRSSHGAYSPSNFNKQSAASLQAGRGSPLQLGSPGMRSVSMLSSSPSQGTVGSGPLAQRPTASGTADFQASTRWRYAQSVGNLQS